MYNLLQGFVCHCRSRCHGSSPFRIELDQSRIDIDFFVGFVLDFCNAFDGCEAGTTMDGALFFFHVEERETRGGVGKGRDGVRWGRRTGDGGENPAVDEVDVEGEGVRRVPDFGVVNIWLDGLFDSATFGKRQGGR